MNFSRPVSPLLALLLIGAAVATPAAANCPPFLLYADLGSGSTINGNPNVYTVRCDQVVNTPFNPDCNAADWFACVVTVDVPDGCSGVRAWVQYEGDPEGWTVNVGDSSTNNGFGGDAGTAPAGQNAEVQVLDEDLSVFSAADNPAEVEQLLIQHLGLREGALQFVVENQSLSVGQPFSALATPDLGRLFFLPDEVPEDGNRTVYAGFNRVIAPVGGPNGNRNGCGARRALLVLEE